MLQAMFSNAFPVKPLYVVALKQAFHVILWALEGHQHLVKLLVQPDGILSCTEDVREIKKNKCYIVASFEFFQFLDSVIVAPFATCGLQAAI